MNVRNLITMGACMCLTVLGAAEGGTPVADGQPDLAEVTRLWKSGQTIPAETAAHYPLPKIEVENDTGVNVLIDLAHQCSFAMMWGLAPALKEHGFRPVGSQATLDTVLTPGTLSRVRLPVNEVWPFGWWPNPRYNVVITHQSGPESQDYLPEERAALKAFVEAGGGLIIVGWAQDEEKLEGWTLNKLAAELGGSFSPETDVLGDEHAAMVRVDRAWEVFERGRENRPVIARRGVGKGHVVLMGSLALIEQNDNDTEEAMAAKAKRLGDLVAWAAAGSEPAGGDTRLPDAMWGGGGIYPELEQRVGNLVVYYARNQKDELLTTVRDDLPDVGRQLQAWLPSPVPEEPMVMVLAAGGGGGWAINAYDPKEIGVISLERVGIISVFAHELAHTMAGPPNNDGAIAADWPHGNQGESHAGWFQGKIVAKYTDNKIVKDCNRLFEIDPTGSAIDLAAPTERIREKFGEGAEWTKIWWVFQKLDERYGPTWYPRWRWVQYTRWAHTPDKHLTWDETVEDMSIAAGEDLFPFFRAIGTSTERDRLRVTEFLGKTIKLPVAPIEVTPAGEAKLGPIGDYKKPLDRPGSQPSTAPDLDSAAGG
ncbi:MAG: hypothetical protein JW889_10850 [Verrucomicrobia bacterium]|nr:hypothetical protein [Verrucomicrobiota bacterium]